MQQQMKPEDHPYRATLFLDDGRELVIYTQAVTPFMDAFPRCVVRVDWVNQNREQAFDPMIRHPLTGRWTKHPVQNTCVSRT